MGYLSKFLLTLTLLPMIAYSSNCLAAQPKSLAACLGWIFRLGGGNKVPQTPKPAGPMRDVSGIEDLRSKLVLFSSNSGVASLGRVILHGQNGILTCAFVDPVHGPTSKQVRSTEVTVAESQIDLSEDISPDFRGMEAEELVSQIVVLPTATGTEYFQILKVSPSGSSIRSFFVRQFSRSSNGERFDLIPMDAPDRWLTLDELQILETPRLGKDFGVEKPAEGTSQSGDTTIYIAPPTVAPEASAKFWAAYETAKFSGDLSFVAFHFPEEPRNIFYGYISKVKKSPEKILEIEFVDATEEGLLHIGDFSETQLRRMDIHISEKSKSALKVRVNAPL